MSVPVGIIGVGTYFPTKIERAADLVEGSGIPADILWKKMGIRQRHVAGLEDTVSFMASEAAKDAIAQSGISPEQINMVISHGSELKDHIVWNSAGLTPEQSVYLEDYGHIRSVDQAVQIEIGLQQGKIKPGDLIVIVGAGTGSTWSAIAVRWG